MCLSLAAVSGCKENPAPVAVVERLEMEESYQLLTLGDKVQIPVSYNEIEGNTLVWTSSSPSVVSVDQNGFVEALKVGAATVTASYGSKQVSCRVEVALVGNVPTLTFGVDEGKEISLMKGSTLALGASIQFNGNVFEDGALEYQVADESIGSIVDGKFVAKDREGSTTVSVWGTWRGQAVQLKTLSVKVVSEKTVLLNSGRLTSLQLYMAAEHEGVSYPTSQTISSVFVSENNTEITDFSLSIVDENIAIVQPADEGWIVLPKRAGETQLVVSYGAQEFPFDVVVERPVAQLGFVVDYSLENGKYWDNENAAFKGLNELVAGFDSIVSYELGGTEYTAQGGTLAVAAGKEQQITLYSDTVGYRGTFDVYTMIVDALKDFEKIYAGSTKAEIGGQYMLAKDLIEPNAVLSMPEGMVANNFAGEFDGKGHVLSFTLDHGTTQRFGLFGEFLNGATIKNLALSNVKKTGTYAKNPAGVLCYEAAPEGSDKISTLQNLFVNVSFVSTGTTYMVLMHNASWLTAMDHVIIHAPAVPNGDPCGSFARGECISLSHSYIVSNAVQYADSATEQKKIEIWRKRQPPCYESYTELKNAGNDYSSFSAEYWDTTTYGVPVWKSLVKDFKLQ